jgi:hypothetical protein
MTKKEFIETMEREQTLDEMADDTSRTPAERDLARILQISTLLLLRKDFNSAKRILEIYVEEVGRI